MVEGFCNGKGTFVHRNYSLWNRKLLNVAVFTMNNMFYLLICYSTDLFLFLFIFYFFAFKLLLVTFPRARECSYIRNTGREQNMNTKYSDWTFTIREQIGCKKKRLWSVGFSYIFQHSYFSSNCYIVRFSTASLATNELRTVYQPIY